MSSQAPLKNIIISHFKREHGNLVYQSNDEHCKGVAELAETFAKEFDMGKWGYLMGLLHDKGKESIDFQNYILSKANGTDSKKTQHAYVGALILKKQDEKKRIYPLIGNPIMGHHRGLYDKYRMDAFIKEKESEFPEEDKIPEDLKVLLKDKIDLPKAWKKNLHEWDYHHLVRILFSCLVDADYLDTERFMNPMDFEKRQHNKQPNIQDLLCKLEKHLKILNIEKSTVNEVRNSLQNECRKKASCKPGFYSLTAPTGSGKTLSSLLWALGHAVTYGKKRIIIAIPYTSIIVQTAEILRSIFGDEYVLEHHNEVETDDEKLRLATENWDYPIIVTTNVQLFESIFSNRTSKCRKLHNISNSIIILDEVQTLPTGFLQPIVNALDTYVRLFKVSILFTTATQPILKGDYQTGNFDKGFRGITEIKEIMSNIDVFSELNKRVRILDETGAKYTVEDLAKALMSHKRVLCIVNTRKLAREIFNNLPKEGKTIHLSRMMCPVHVRKKIEEIKKALVDPNVDVIRVVSTQLVEAGVDIDFPVVFRQEAGLDSIIQAAGRCNREGKIKKGGETHVFSLTEEYPIPQGQISLCNDARKNMKAKSDQWLSPDAMNEYFKQVYSRTQSFDRNEIEKLLCCYKRFEEAAEKFKLIDDCTIPIIVECDENKDLVSKLKKEAPSYTLVRQLREYSINLRESDLEKMKKNDTAMLVNGIYIACKGSYNRDVGLLPNKEIFEEVLII